MTFDEVRAIVTGAAGGLGGHFALRLAEGGAAVVAGDVDAGGLDALRARAEGLPGVVLTRRLDVADEGSVQEFVADASLNLEGVNVLVNCAGILSDGLLVGREDSWVRKLPLEQWRRVIDTNLTGAYLMAREVAADMLRREERGVIVNISSLARSGNVGQTSYAASKSGLDACTRTWAMELAPSIRVGAIAPGLIETPMLGRLPEGRVDDLLGQIPLARAGTVEEVWLALRFIIECEYFTGRVIEVDGGLTF
jgi:3-oxoacyl-[acyl-carrier protein] reductase